MECGNSLPLWTFSVSSFSFQAKNAKCKTGNGKPEAESGNICARLLPLSKQYDSLLKIPLYFRQLAR
jgi:hypothetical protein